MTTKTFDSLLEELEQINPDWCNVVELRVFLGLNSVETANALGIKFMLCDRKWFEAGRWMRERFNSADAGNAGPSK
jgi:DNA-directed RNA polymerase specialized sigma24 family protein